jgi:hypothetical protein
MSRSAAVLPDTTCCPLTEMWHSLLVVTCEERGWQGGWWCVCVRRLCRTCKGAVDRTCVVAHEGVGVGVSAGLSPER